MMGWFAYLMDVCLGIVAGVAYFSHLWKMTRRLCQNHIPGWNWCLQAVLRSALLIGFFWFLSGSNWLAWLACMLGWLIGRHIMMSLLQNPEGTL